MERNEHNTTHQETSSYSNASGQETETSGSFAYGPIVSGALFLVVFGVWFWKMVREHRRGRLVASSWMVMEHQQGNGIGVNGIIRREDSTVISDSTVTCDPSVWRRTLWGRRATATLPTATATTGTAATATPAPTPPSNPSVY